MALMYYCFLASALWFMEVTLSYAIKISFIFHNLIEGCEDCRKFLTLALQGLGLYSSPHQLVDEIACQSPSGLCSPDISFNLVFGRNAFVLSLQ